MDRWCGRKVMNKKTLTGIASIGYENLAGCSPSPLGLTLWSIHSVLIDNHNRSVGVMLPAKPSWQLCHSLGAYQLILNKTNWNDSRRMVSHLLAMCFNFLLICQSCFAQDPFSATVH